MLPGGGDGDILGHLQGLADVQAGAAGALFFKCHGPEHVCQLAGEKVVLLARLRRTGHAGVTRERAEEARRAGLTDRLGRRC